MMTGIVELILIVVVLGCIYNSFSSGRRTIMDLLTSRLQGAIAYTEPRTCGTPQRMTTTSMCSLYGVTMGRLCDQQRTVNRMIAKQNKKNALDRKLFQLKESSWDVLTDSKQRPFMGLACASCIPFGQIGFSSDKLELSLRNILQEKYLMERNLAVRTFRHIYQAYSLKKFDYPHINETVLSDKRLNEAIALTTKEQCHQRGDKSEKAVKKLMSHHEKRAKDILEKMRSKMSDTLLRCTAWMMFKVLPCFLTSVVVHPAQVEMLQRASQTGLPLIFLPLHRSHLDYILITFILFCINVKSPMVAAGDNLNIPFFGRVLRGLGAFFIKRRMDPVAGRRDTIYRAVLHTYMMQSLQAGHYIEFFAEGGRTRTGKPCMPKGGLLSVIVDAYMDNTIEDALLIPVSLNYERLVDGDFTHEQMGQPKKMETLSSALVGIWNALTSNYGSARIDFNQPFSLKDMITAFKDTMKARNGSISNDLSLLKDDDEDEDDASDYLPKKSKKRPLQSTLSSSSLYGTDVVVEEHRQLVDSIARHIIYDCSNSTAVMSTNMIAFLLLTSYRDGVCLDDLVSHVDQFRDQLTWAKRDCGFTGDSIDVINHAVNILGSKLVKRERRVVDGQEVGYICPVTSLPHVIELSYYSNGLLPHYVIDASIATAIYSLLGFDSKVNTVEKEACTLTQKDILETALEICDIFQFEFIFTKGCQSLESSVIEKIESFVTDGILRQKQDLFTDDERRGFNIARDFDEESEDSDISLPSREYELDTTNSEAMRRLHHLQGILQPLFNTYFVTVMSMTKVVDKEVMERDLMKSVLMEIEKQLNNKELKYCESMSTDTVKNALKLLDRWGVLECHTQDKTKCYYLTNKYDSEEALKPVSDYIAKFNTDISSSNEAPVVVEDIGDT